MHNFDATGVRIGIRRPEFADCDEFVAMVQASQSLHRPWADPPASAERFHVYVQSRQSPTDDGFLICDLSSGQIVGVINLNVIVRGSFHSAYLGYYAAASAAGRGLMTEALLLVARYAFREMRLHRLEANVQPDNVASIALIRKCGFRKEGFSPKYLKVNGQWRDHERWALLADQEA